MKIKETVERECCEIKDLKLYNGKLPPDIKLNEKIWFCPYCGQFWYNEGCDYHEMEFQVL